MLSSQLPRDGTVETAEEPTEELSTCPLCNRVHSTRTDLRVHLMTSHNKSELTETLLCACEDPIEPL